MTTNDLPKIIVPVSGNPSLEKKDKTNPPEWSKYEVRLRPKSRPSDADISANVIARLLYDIIGSSSNVSNRWQVDWVQFMNPRGFIQSTPRGMPIFMLRFEDPSDGVAARLALDDNNEFDVIDSIVN